MKQTDQDIVQYYAVNEQLVANPGKLAVQVAHAAATMTLHYLLNDSRYYEVFQAWLNNGQKKVVLQGPEERLRQLANEGFPSIRDAGLMENPEGFLTVVVLPPMNKKVAEERIAGLKVL
ncbi:MULTISPECIES: aminoacyl-tRNA hydrolase [Paenibacillus]|uniref:peptidyl-tRNA hydrolase n=1 Tax=Paenibacillus naphthalenovorans TaxID=162209 RepID=A0A0U2W6R3_9BACL|nr:MULTISPECIES: peptidyl-tRNA hydrolase [Paenibacillus]ALS24244.1 peptidyl-tRNA hydrolase II [Paenibacillus naphthalenovorans]NTZ20345.1 peptidyl-tRNA hydrolase [Paenibacillus sp. JMULE4]SDI51065.1 peptidyl-tRNA hydrolase, PTH2 family [Paenibacillus naphthalenovorans]